MLYTISFWFLLFLLYSFFGYIAEVVSCSINSKRLVLNRGFLIGPYLPIYGFGCLIMVLFLFRYEDDLLVLFIMSAFLCTVLEYFTSLFMEKLFKLRWWDYSDRKFQINGRVCLDNALLFGLGGIFVVKVLHPFLSWVVYLLPSLVTIWFAVIMLFIFLFDIIESSYIIVRLKINVDHYIHKDATRKIKKEVLKAIQKHTTLTSRLLRAFPNLTDGANKRFIEFAKLLDSTRKDIKIQKLKRKIEKVKNK